MLADRADSVELRAVYGEMLEKSKGDPENRIWYVPWKITRKDNKESVGELHFKGPVKNSSVEICCGGLSAHESNGYGSEALQAITQWAFGRSEVVFVETEADPDDTVFRGILEKCGFVPDAAGREGSAFVSERPLTNWAPIYMLFGMSIGMAAGQWQDRMLWGMAIGMSLGVLIGMLLNRSEKKGREILRQKREAGE